MLKIHELGRTCFIESIILTEYDVELATHQLCDNLKGILFHYCNVRDRAYFSVVYGVNILDLAVFARRSRRVSR